MKRLVYKISFPGHFLSAAEGGEKWMGFPSDIQKLLESECLKPIRQELMFGVYEVEIRIKTAKGK